MNGPEFPEPLGEFFFEEPSSEPIPEFTDTYSDDLGFIQDALKALKQKHGKLHVHTASACRLYIVMMVSAIDIDVQKLQDQILKRKGTKKLNGDLEVYLSRNEKVEHTHRAEALKRFFRSCAVEIQTDFLDDFFVIKKLRNILVHGNWRKSNRERMDSCGFPTDTRNLTDQHLNRARKVYEQMLLALSCCRIWLRERG